MTAATVIPAAMPVGERVELGRYRTPHGERLLVGQRIHGIVRIADVPAAERGRRYIVERGLARRAELDAVVTDYLD
jgi:hypothetical protein